MPATISIMIVIFVTSILGFMFPRIQLMLMLHPFSIIQEKQYYRLITADLVHNDPVHLLINESVLYFASGNLEIYLRQHYGNGSFLFLLIYFMSALTGSVIILIRYFREFGYSSSGASGSAIGTMFGYMILQPHVTAFYLPFFGAVPNLLGAFCFIVGFIIYQMKSKNPMINNELHLYSAVGGVLTTLILFHHVLLK